MLINKDWVEPLDKDKIPNFANLIDAQLSPTFDPDRTYSLPWQSGMTGIAWNEDVTGPVTSIDQLLGDKKLKGKVTMLTEMADSVGLVMLSNGDDPSVVTDETFDKATARIKEGVGVGTDPAVHRQRLRPAARRRATLAAAVAWSGDVVQLLAEQSEAEVGHPQGRAGRCGRTTCWCRSEAKSPRPRVYMNFVYDPKIAAQIAAYVNYVPPGQGCARGAREDRSRDGREPR